MPNAAGAAGKSISMVRQEEEEGKILILFLLSPLLYIGASIPFRF